MKFNVKHIAEHSYEPLDAKLAVVAKKDKMSRFKKKHVFSYSYENKQGADMDGKR